MDESRSVEWDQMINRAAVARHLADGFKENPPDVEEWAKKLLGLPQLNGYAITHLRANNYGEAFRILQTSTQAMLDLLEEVRWAYVLSGQASDDFLENLANAHKDKE